MHQQICRQEGRPERHRHTSTCNILQSQRCGKQHDAAKGSNTFGEDCVDTITKILDLNDCCKVNTGCKQSRTSQYIEHEFGCFESVTPHPTNMEVGNPLCVDAICISRCYVSVYIPYRCLSFKPGSGKNTETNDRSLRCSTISRFSRWCPARMIA